MLPHSLICCHEFFFLIFQTFDEVRRLLRLDPQQAAHLFLRLVDGMRVRLRAEFLEDRVAGGLLAAPLGVEPAVANCDRGLFP